ncbi:MAG: conjugal transfer protein TrbL [Propionicimonas sp.]|nr:conjugal transfer protein TrbL [Propionicimonas sp.]
MSICDVPVISSVCDFVGEGVASLVAAPFDWLGQAMAGAAAWLFEAVWWVFDTTTLVDVTSAEYVGIYNILFGVAAFIMLVFFCLQLITGLIHRDPTALSRAALGLAKSVLGSFLVITLTALLLEVTDQLAVGIVQATGNSMETMGTQIALLATGLAGINLAAPGVGAILTIFLAGLALSAAAIVWFSLLIRKALLLVAIVFGPVALAGATWDATKGWFAKWATFVIALIFSKLVLVVIFLVAIGQVASPIEADLASISDPIAGVVLMFVAAFAPYITYKFLSFVGFDMYHAMSSEQEAKSALNRPIPIPAAPSADSAKKVLDGGPHAMRVVRCHRAAAADQAVPAARHPPLLRAGRHPPPGRGRARVRLPVELPQPGQGPEQARGLGPPVLVRVPQVRVRRRGQSVPPWSPVPRSSRAPRPPGRSSAARSAEPPRDTRARPRSRRPLLRCRPRRPRRAGPRRRRHRPRRRRLRPPRRRLVRTRHLRRRPSRPLGRSRRWRPTRTATTR